MTANVVEAGIGSIPAPVTTTIDHRTPAKICVFCGSSSGTSPAHMAAARQLAHEFHARNISLVYGGGTKGLMGELARTLVELSGPDRVHGYIPEALIRYEQPGVESQGDRTTNKPPSQVGGSSAIRNSDNDAQDGAEERHEMERSGITREYPHDSEIYQKYGRTSVVRDMHTRKQLMAKEVIEAGPGSGFVAMSGGYGTMEELMEMITWNQLGIHAKGVCVLNIEGYYDGLIDWVKSAVTAGFVAPGNAGILAEARDPAQVIECLKNYQVAEGRLPLDWSQK